MQPTLQVQVKMLCVHVCVCVRACACVWEEEMVTGHERGLTLATKGLYRDCDTMK